MQYRRRHFHAIITLLSLSNFMSFLRAFPTRTHTKSHKVHSHRHPAFSNGHFRCFDDSVALVDLINQ